MHRASDPLRPVVIVGNATQDSAFFVSHLPSEDEVCAVHKNVTCLGGRGVVPALVAAALGLKAELCTVVGSDLRDDFVTFLSSHHVGTSGVKWDNVSCGVTQYVAFIGEDTGTSFAVAKAATLDWHCVESQLHLVRQAQAAYFSTNDLAFNLELLACVPADIPVIHNLGVRLDARPEYIDAMLAKATVLVGNRPEMASLAALTGLTPPALFSSSTSLESIIITAGREGAQVFERGDHSPVAHPALKVDRVGSPVGAGDSFAVGILWSMIAGRSRSDGIRLGMALGALAVASERSYPDLLAVAEIPR